MKSLIKTTVVGFVAASLLALAGCETTPASSEVTISPSSATIKTGESLTLTASGGYDYRWELENPTYGILSSLSGSSVTYTSTYQFTTNATTTVAQKITVTSYISGATSSTTTNSSTTTSSYQVTAEAVITHLPPTAE